MDFLDFSNDKDAFGLLPKGKYLLICDEAELKDSANGQYIKVKFKVLEGEYEGRIIFQNYTVVHSNEQAAKIGRGQLKNFLECAGAKSYALRSPVDLIGLRAMASIKIEEGKDGYSDQNKVSSFSKSAVKEEAQKAGNPFA